jgi:hypothetical protein
MGGGLKSRCVGRVYGADGAVLASTTLKFCNKTQHISTTFSI